MKRPILLVAGLALLLAAASAAQAADIKATGEWLTEAAWSNNWDFIKGRHDPSGQSALNGGQERFNIWTRLRTRFDLIVNENLKGVLATEIGSAKWGASGVFDLGQTPQNLALRWAYLDFNFPGTKVDARVGFQDITLPYEVGEGSHILGDELTAAIVSFPVNDDVSVLVGYARALSGNAAYVPATATPRHDFMDLGILSVPVSFADDFRLNPFVMVGYAAANAIGQNGNFPTGLHAQNATGEGARLLVWAGLTFGMDLLDPIKIKGDLNYGREGAAKAQNRMSGWLFGLSVEYDGWDFATPELFFVYTTGEQGNATKGNGSSGRMPQLSADEWGVGSFFFGNDSMLAGSIGAHEASTGFWTVGLSLKNMSFLEQLFHTVHVLYARGTNSKEIGDRYTTAANQGNTHNIQYGQTLSTRDSLWELDLNTEYRLFRDLTLHFDLGLILPSFSREVWGDDYAGAAASKVSLGLSYEF